MTRHVSIFAVSVFSALLGCGGSGYSTNVTNPPVPSGTPGIVQVAKEDCEIVLCVSPQPIAFANPVAPGNSIAVVFWFNHPIGSEANSSTDNNHDTYTNVQTVQQSQNNTIVVYIAKNVYGGPTQVTIAGPPPSTGFSVAAFELSGVYGDVDAVQSQTSFPFTGGLCASGSVNTTHADVLLGFTLNDISLSTPITYGTGFTGQFQTHYFAVESEVATSTGSYQATFSTGPPPDQQPIYIATSGIIAIY